MLFNFQEFINELRENEEKKEIIEKYENLYGKIEGDIQDQIWYREYVMNFSYKEYLVPEDLKDSFDWKLLLQLLFASFSSEAKFIDNNGEKLPDIEITVTQGGQTVIEKVSNLWSFQIYKLYEIYSEEQIKLQILIKEDAHNAESIIFQRYVLLQKFGIVPPRLLSSSKEKKENTLRLFNFQAFIEELRENQEKKETIEKYEKLYGKIEGDIQDQIWYKEYIDNFEYIPFQVPDELKDEFDWEVLLKLIAGSFSSRCKIKLQNEISTFNIEVQNDNQIVDKNIGELWSYQILRLYEIYAEEQINLQLLLMESSKEEKQAILQQRSSKRDEWNKHIINLQTQIDIDKILGV